jgi:hypothetical protein
MKLHTPSVHDFGPHGVDLSIPRRHTKSHVGRKHFETIERLKAEVRAQAEADRDRADRNAQRRESRGGDR